MLWNGLVGFSLVAGTPLLVASVLGIPVGIPLITVMLLLGVSLVIANRLEIRALLLIFGGLLMGLQLGQPEGFVVLLMLPFVLAYALPRLPLWSVLVPSSVLITWVVADRAFASSFALYLIFFCLAYPYVHRQGCLALSWAVLPLRVPRKGTVQVWNEWGETVGAILPGLFVEHVVVDAQRHIAGAVLPTGEVIDASRRRVGHIAFCCSGSAVRASSGMNGARLSGVVLDTADFLVGRITHPGTVTDGQGKMLGFVDRAVPFAMLAGGAALSLLLPQRVLRDAPSPGATRAVQPD
jgi:hypothetical protein